MRHSYIDKYSGIDSYIHRLDPRIKIISFFSFILCVIFTKPDSFISFSLYGLVIAGLILWSRIPPLFILRRCLVIIPFVLMIAVFIPFFKEGNVAGGYSFGTLNITVSYDGLMIFWNVLIKASFSILIMILLMASIGFSDFLKALERLKFPRLFTMIISFMYRYIFVLQDEMMKMKQARDARYLGTSRWLCTKTLANIVGVLFIRAYERGEKVYLAMCARGFNGEIRTMHNFRASKGDFCFLLFIISILVGIKLIGA